MRARPSLPFLALLCVMTAGASPLPAVFGGEASPATGAPAAFSFGEIDELYLHRDADGNLDKSMALIERRLQESPDDPGALWRLARGLVSKGNRAGGDKEKIGLYAQAEAAADRAMQKAPQDAKACYWKGMAMGLEGRTRGLFKSMSTVGPLKRLMRRAIELDPKDPAPHRFLGEMLYRLPGVAGGSKKDALRELETAVALGPDSVGSYLALARAYEGQGRKDDARRILTRALEVKTPDDPAQAERDIPEARKLLDSLGGPLASTGP